MSILFGIINSYIAGFVDFYFLCYNLDEIPMAEAGKIT